MAESALRDRLVSVRLSEAEFEYLEQLTQLHVTDRSSMLRHLIITAPLWRVQVAPLAGATPIAAPQPLVLRRRTPEERLAYLSTKRAEWTAAGRDVELLDLVIESLHTPDDDLDESGGVPK